MLTCCIVALFGIKKCCCTKGSVQRKDDRYSPKLTVVTKKNSTIVLPSSTAASNIFPRCWIHYLPGTEKRNAYIHVILQVLLHGPWTSSPSFPKFGTWLASWIYMFKVQHLLYVLEFRVRRGKWCAESTVPYVIRTPWMNTKIFALPPEIPSNITDVTSAHMYLISFSYYLPQLRLEDPPCVSSSKKHREKTGVSSCCVGACCKLLPWL